MRKNLLFILLIAAIFSLVLLSSYQINGGFSANGDYQITNINIFKHTPAWELALAVKDQNIRTIEKIAKDHPQLLDYQESKYGATLLVWAVGMEKYESAEALLKSGANPNIKTTDVDGETALFIASCYSWIDHEAKKDPKYVKLLLKYGADPNIPYTGSDIDGQKTIIEPGTSPLMHSIRCGIEKTKALVEAGADINYKTPSGDTAAISALTFKSVENSYYLIVQKKAQITDPYYRRASYGNEDPNEKFYPVQLLRNWVYDLDSNEYKMKMEIVQEFARQGANYWDTEIYTSTLDQIQKLYPDTWEEYIKKY